MIGLSSLLGASQTYGDKLRYSTETNRTRFGTHGNHGPVVVWSVTRTCNLRCIHCYASSENIKYDGELSTEEALKVIDDLAAFHVPVILFSGGEPFIRPDILQLAEYAISKGIRVTFSTNGTLITEEVARKIKEMGVSYVGISLDGIGEVHDQFRRKEKAFEYAIRGVRNCLSIGQKVGLRFTMNRHNIDQLPNILQLLEDENIPRACFYHLVYSGRGSTEDDISHEETRQALDLLIDKVLEYKEKGIPKEILTVDNHADGIYLYLKMKEKDPALAEEILMKLKRNGGNRSGVAICNIDHRGFVHPDQFSQYITLGNVKEQSFGEIWTNQDSSFLEKMRNRKAHIKGRCASCQYFDLCNGNFRPRAQGYFGDYWESDPQCYLTDEEIGLVM